jgi:hypothetical protein
MDNSHQIGLYFTLVGFLANFLNIHQLKTGRPSTTQDTGIGVIK